MDINEMNLQQYTEWLDKNLSSQTSIPDDAVFYDCRQKPFDLYGLYKPETYGSFVRVPNEITQNLPVGMQFFAGDTAGGRVRFTTNSKYVALKCKQPCRHLRNMCYCGSSGFDIYVDGEKTSKFYKSFIPPFSHDGEWVGVITFPSRKTRSLTLNFPLYNHVDELQIGLQKNSVVTNGKKYTIENPIVHYGGSHVQGASANKPGNAIAHFLSRKYDANFVNLGFSGNALGEIEMAEYIVSLNPSLVIMEYDHNAPNADWLQKTHYPFYETIRRGIGNVPIIMASKQDFYNCSYYVKKQSENVERRKVIIDNFNRAVASGDKNVYFVDGKNMLAGDFREDCTMDGCHPTDLGFYRIAQKFIKVIDKNDLLKLKK